MVTKKDFKAIAKIIERLHPLGCKTGLFNRGEKFALKNVATELANYFITQNPRFDRQKFLDACGLKQENKTVVIDETAASEQEKIMAKTGCNIVIKKDIL